MAYLNNFALFQREFDDVEYDDETKIQIAQELEEKQL